MPDVLDRMAAFLGRSVLRKTLDSHCRLVTADGDHALVADGGALVSVFRLEGFRSMPGDQELTDAVDKLRMALSSYLRVRGYALQFWFGHSPGLGAADIKRSVSSIERVARDVGLDVQDLLDERLRRLPERLTGERAYIAVWSSPSLLNKREAKNGAKEISENMKGSPAMRDGQWPALAIDALKTRHHSMCEALARECTNVGIEVELLDVYEALASIKGILYPQFWRNGSKWRAILPQDHIRSRMPTTKDELNGRDVSNLVWPSLSRQLVSEDGEVIDQTTVKIGDTIFSAFDLVVAQEIVVKFNDLIRRVLDSKDRISWRVSMLIESDAFQGQLFNEQYANLFTWTSPIKNRRIKEAFGWVRQNDGAGVTSTRWRVSFAAWCDKDELKRLQAHVSTLRECVQAWGNCETDALVGDPVECVMSSTMGITTASTAPAAAASLTDVLAMAPIARPASPWQQGTVMLRTPDGKLWPYQPGSSRQLSWLDAIVGKPGSGKSVLMNSINLGIALSPQTGREAGHGLLPRISVIDVGPSSAGLISLIRDSLPVARRHEAVYHRLKMSDRYAINFFDTQLGLRFPLAHERTFQGIFVSLLCTPDGEELPYDGINQIAAAAIDEAFNKFSDGRSPKRYVPNESYEVDKALDELGFEFDDSVTWWEVTDFFLEKGRLHEAALAQRFAVPTLGDLVTMSNSETVREPFRDMRAPTGEDIVKSFQRFITAATRDFPILARPTRFDVSNARIVALDLADVAGGHGPRAQRQTAIMYMLARHAVTTDFWLDKDEIQNLDIPETVRRLHLTRIENNRQMGKRLCYDEWHMTNGLGIRHQTVEDVRVTRKLGIQITIASQLIEDFDPAIQKLASSFWFCNVPNKESIKEIAERFELSESTQKAMATLNGPIEGVGAPVMAMMSLRTGTYVQYLYNELGPIELWALSTTAEDTSLRSILYDRLGPKQARQVLARRFPSGTIKSWLERKRADLEDRGQTVDEEAEANLIEGLADELSKEVA